MRDSSGEPETEFRPSFAPGAELCCAFGTDGSRAGSGSSSNDACFCSCSSVGLPSFGGLPMILPYLVRPCTGLSDLVALGYRGDRSLIG